MQIHNYFDYLGNLYRCPFGNRKPDCPVFLACRESFKERLDWFKALSAKKKDEVVVHHQHCKIKREKRKVLT